MLSKCYLNICGSWIQEITYSLLNGSWKGFFIIRPVNPERIFERLRWQPGQFLYISDFNPDRILTFCGHTLLSGIWCFFRKNGESFADSDQFLQAFGTEVSKILPRGLQISKQRLFLCFSWNSISREEKFLTTYSFLFLCHEHVKNGRRASYND